MDTARSKSGNDNSVPRRLTRSMTTKAVEAASNTNVAENRRVTRSMTKHLRECNPNRTGKDADTSKGQMTQKTDSRNGPRKGDTRKNDKFNTFIVMD